MRHRSQEPIDADFQVIENPENLPALRRREPLFKPRTEPIISSWKNLFLFLVVVGCIVFGRVVIYPVVNAIIHPLFGR